MTSIIPFKFDNVQLFSVTIDDKVWTRAKEVVKSALEYQRQTADVIKDHCSRENYAHKWQLSKYTAAVSELKWPFDSRKDDYYINEEGMNELVFTSQQDKAKAFRKYCCNELFPKIRKLLVDKMLEEKDTQLTLLNDDLTESEDLVRQLEYNNTGLQGEIRAKDEELAVLRQRYLPILEDDRKNYGMTIIAKNNESAEYPFISICGQHGYRRQKKKMVLLKNPGSTEFADGDTPNAIVTYNMWREHGLIETDPRKPRDFRLVNIGEDQLFLLRD